MKIYHATWPTNVDSILDDGINAGWDQRVYFANKPHYAAGFLRMRGGQIVGHKEIEINDKIFVVPDIIPHSSIAVIEVDADLLGAGTLEEGEDHNAAMYPEDLEVVAHVGKVPAEAIVGVITYDIET